MDRNQQSSADHIIEHLNAIDVDGETMEYIINGVGMSYQMLRQLIINSSDFDINNIITERDEMLSTDKSHNYEYTHVTWDDAYSNTSSKKMIFSYKKICKHCGDETEYTATREMQQLGNAIQRIVQCNECNNHFVEQWGFNQ